jgi:hypothetical protein
MVVRAGEKDNDANGTNGNQHDMGFARLFTGAKLISRGGQPWGGSASVDQLLAQAWKVDSLTLAVLASQSESLSNFLIEAQLHGLPAVAYDIVGVGECFAETPCHPFAPFLSR